MSKITLAELAEELGEEIGLAGGLSFSCADEMAENAKAPRYLINRFLESDSHGILAGASMAFKSFMALKIAHSICTGQDFFNFEVFDTGLVMYICGEGKGALSRRMRALSIVHGGFDGNLIVLNDKIFIDDRDHVRELGIEIAKRRPALVIMDTFSSMNSGTNENDNSEVSSVLSILQSTISNGYTSSMIVHHFGKNKDLGLRGASAFTANSDYVMIMDRIENTMITTLSSGKTKDGDQFVEVEAEARVVELGIDNQDGTKATSLVLESISGLTKGSKHGANDEILWSCFNSAMEDSPVQFSDGVGVKPVDFAMFVKHSQHFFGQKQGTIRQTINRFVTRMVKEEKMLEINGLLIDCR
ncbi:MAG: AAA family ATPase [Candidatus Paceibacterota bacterium]